MFTHKNLIYISVLVISIAICIYGVFGFYEALLVDKPAVKKQSSVDIAYFQRAIPSTPVTAINDTHLSLTHLYRLSTANDKHLLITKDRRYLVIGAVMDLQTGKLIGNNAQENQANQTNQAIKGAV